jgi:hypothetical protein
MGEKDLSRKIGDRGREIRKRDVRQETVWETRNRGVRQETEDGRQ